MMKFPWAKCSRTVEHTIMSALESLPRIEHCVALYIDRPSHLKTLEFNIRLNLI